MNNRERKQELIALQIACLQILRDTKLPFEVMKTIEKYSDDLAKENIELLRYDMPVLMFSPAV